MGGGVRCEEKHVERSDVQVCHQNPMGSHCTMGQVGLSMGVHCPCLGPHIPLSIPSGQRILMANLDMSGGKDRGRV